jgi:hypothetical protein
LYEKKLAINEQQKYPKALQERLVAKTIMPRSWVRPKRLGKIMVP